MIIDSSALISMLLDEDDAGSFFAAISTAVAPRMSAATYVETAVVADSRPNRAPSNRLDPLLAALDVTIEPLTVAQAQIARRAYQEFGKGSQHPAKLNLGDCFSYALAIENDEPLLFKGDDFGHTDVRVASAE